MKKSLLALAALTAFAGAASAQSSVTIGGFLNQAFTKRVGSEDNEIRDVAGSRLNFSIVEDLGGGMFGIAGFEHRFSPDVGQDATNTNTLSTATGNNFWNGYSWVGLRGGFGTIKMGREYTPSFSLVQNQLDPWGGDTVAEFRTLYVMPGAFTVGTPAIGRMPNSVRYDFSAAGFTIGGQMGEGGYNTFGGSDLNAIDKPYSIAANYSAGPLFLGISYDDGAYANDELLNMGARFTMAGITMRFSYLDGKDRNDLDVKGWMLAANMPVGGGDLRFGYGEYDADATAYDDSKRFAIGYHYNLSKRTKIFADYAYDGGDTPAFENESSGYDLGIQVNF